MKWEQIFFLTCPVLSGMTAGMARQPRLVLADWPHHVTQRGYQKINLSPSF